MRMNKRDWIALNVGLIAGCVGGLITVYLMLLCAK